MNELPAFWGDLPIRDYVPGDSLCKYCVNVLSPCSDIPKTNELINGFNCVVACKWYRDYRAIEPPTQE